MKVKLKIPNKREIVKIDHIEVEAELPETEKYFMKNDDGRVFPRGIILFAFIPKYGNAGKYRLYEVERHKQDFNDFEVENDLRHDAVKGIRETALHILLGHKHPHYYSHISAHGFSEITKEEFTKKRDELLTME